MTKTKIMSENDKLSLENTTIIIFDKTLNIENFTFHEGDT